MKMSFNALVTLFFITFVSLGCSSLSVDKKAEPQEKKKKEKTTRSIHDPWIDVDRPFIDRR